MSPLRRAADFKRVFLRGRKIFAQDLKMYVFQREGRGKIRLGFLVKKEVGPAVKRNRVRRLLREAYRRHQEDLKEGLDLVVVVKESLGGKTFNQVEEELFKTLKEGEILKK